MSRTHVLLFTISAIMLSVLGSCTPALVSWRIYTKEGVEAFNRGDLVKAERYFQRSVSEAQGLEKKPQQLYSSLLCLSFVYEVQERFSEAELSVRQALKVIENESEPDDPERAYPLLRLAKLYWLQQKYGDAESWYKKALDFLNAEAPNDNMTDRAKLAYGLMLLKMDGEDSIEMDDDIVRIKGVIFEGEYPRLVEMVPYDEPPKPIGGYEAIHRNIEYPESAQEAGIEGLVSIVAFVDKTGKVTATVVLKGIPDTGLDEAAIRAIKETKFVPAKQKGKAVGVWINIPINFRLR